MERIPISEPFLKGKELEYVMNSIKSGWISSIGEYVPKFEEEFSKYCGVKYGITTCNGTTALHLALAALDIKDGDEVIVPTLTFIAPINAITYTGAKPVLIDSEEDSWNIDPNLIEKKITDKTKAIIPVHLYGHPCEMDKIMKIAKEHNLYVVEDCAEAHGAEYKGRKVGSFGDIACFSFYGNKIITTGEGGMCITNNKELSEKMSILRDHGMSKEKKYWHLMVGFNYRMTNIQAAIGCAQLEYIDEIIKIKRKNAQLYNNLLKNINGITLPPEKEWAKNIYWQYTILLESSYKYSKEELINKLKEKNIESRPFFYPVHTMPPYKGKESFPIAENLSKKGLTLPFSAKLKEEQINRIVDCIK